MLGFREPHTSEAQFPGITLLGNLVNRDCIETLRLLRIGARFKYAPELARWHHAPIFNTGNCTGDSDANYYYYY
jgi:hypothetical protein